MTRTVLSILRQAVEPMTTRDIALEMLVSRALNTDDQKLLALMVKRVGVALRIKAQQWNCPLDERAGPVHAVGGCALTNQSDFMHARGGKRAFGHVRRSIRIYPGDGGHLAIWQIDN